ncbi:uncharacterized protein LOC127277901 isoform X2 [Leptopilina boulardi]|nr:uncharacterized protein LOC127277901 isoform X2 [Leptopilina boulardi]
MQIKSKHNAECLFGNTKISTFKPHVKIPVSTVYLIDICKTLIAELRDHCKVAMEVTDLSTLIIVTVLQIEAKVRIATKSSAYNTFDGELDYRVERTKDSLPVSLFPLSFYIDQIGKVDIQGQTIVPELIDLKYENISKYAERAGLTILPSNVISLPEGNSLTGANQWVRILNKSGAIEKGIIEPKDSGFSLTKEFIENPNNFNWIGILFIEPPRNVVSDFKELNNRYFNFIDRINEKLLNAFAEVDYHEAKGTAAQLVTSKFLNFDQNITMYKVWSTRFVDDHSLEVGGLLRFGFDLEDSDVSRSGEFRCCESFIEAQSPLREFVQKVFKYLRKNLIQSS